jgi:hypothetical protein
MEANVETVVVVSRYEVPIAMLDDLNSLQTPLDTR